jgi:8-oxo-dGTP diphosphatase
MAGKREYPDQPVVGVGGVVIADGRALLIRRGSEPLKGEWSIPGGTLEVGETLGEGLARELREETGLEVKVLELIEAFDRIFGGSASEAGAAGSAARPKYHFVILDYLCEAVSGTARPGGDVTHVAWAREDELDGYNLTTAAMRVLRKAFAMARARAEK